MKVCTVLYVRCGCVSRTGTVGVLVVSSESALKWRNDPRAKCSAIAKRKRLLQSPHVSLHMGHVDFALHSFSMELRGILPFQDGRGQIIAPASAPARAGGRRLPHCQFIPRVPLTQGTAPSGTATSIRRRTWKPSAPCRLRCTRRISSCLPHNRPNGSPCTHPLRSTVVCKDCAHARPRVWPFHLAPDRRWPSSRSRSCATHMQTGQT